MKTEPGSSLQRASLPSGVLLLSMFLAACVAHSAPPTNEGDAGASTGHDIQVLLMGFSDTWTAGVGQTTGELIGGLESSEAVLEVRKLRYHSQLAAYDIAAGPHPGIALLDMMVLTALTRATWDRHWVSRFSDQARPAAKVFAELEDSLWSQSRNWMSLAQIADVRELVDQWLAEHPGAITASFVRFGDFGDIARKPALAEAKRSGGLLAPINDAVQTVDDIRAMGERAIFLSIRMQELMMGRVEIMSRELLLAPEMQQVFSDIHGFQRSSERYAEALEALPVNTRQLVEFTLDQVAHERQATLEQVLAGFALEREAALVQTLEGLQDERIGVLKAVAHVLYWIEMEIKSTVVRLFVVAAGLIVLWFGLRLAYRYWADRVANNFVKSLGVIVLFLLIAAPVLLLGHHLIKLVEPDFRLNPGNMEELAKLIDQVHNDFPESSTQE